MISRIKLKLSIIVLATLLLNWQLAVILRSGNSIRSIMEFEKMHIRHCLPHYFHAGKVQPRQGELSACTKEDPEGRKMNLAWHCCMTTLDGMWTLVTRQTLMDLE